MGLIFATLCVITIVVIVSSINANKKLITLLKSSYGKEPNQNEHELESIKMYWHYNKLNTTDELQVDNITWNDLEMDKVFIRINACLSSVGEEYLYNCLHELKLEPNCLLERNNSIKYFSENTEERLAVQMCLAKVGKSNYNGLAALIFDPNASLFKNTIIFNVLSLLPLLCVLILLHSIAIGFIGIFLSFIINLITYYICKTKINIEIPAISYFASLMNCCKKLLRIKNIEALPIITEINKYYQIFKPLQSKLPRGNKNLFNEMEVFAEYFNILFLVDIRNYNKFMNKIIRNNNDFHALYKAIGELDLAICVSSFRKSLHVFSTPEFTSKKTIEFDELYHPLIPKPVKNTGFLRNNSIITGSNASGKSTFIKALAVNGILAQTIYTCAAKIFKTRFSLILTSMAMRDDISGGDSYFIVEVKSLKRIMDFVKKYPCTCYIDEILRGTNTIERIASSASVLEYLHAQDCLCVAASHDIELTKILADKFDNYHFREQAADNGITFDYKIKQGASTTRNAVKLLSFMNFDDSIVNKAEELVLSYEKNHKW